MASQAGRISRRVPGPQLHLERGQHPLHRFRRELPRRDSSGALQFRDLFLLLFSLAKDRHPIDYRSSVALYAEASGNDWAARRLREFASGMPLVEKIVASAPVWRFLDKDSKATYRLIQELKKL